MSKQLHTALTQMLKMGYYANQNARSGGADYGHEHAVAQVLKTTGFTEVDRALFPKMTKGLLKKWSNGDATATAKLTQMTATLPPGRIIVQPAGSQGFPDILVKDFGSRLIALECKSGKNGLCPMWNDNVPRQNALYVLSSGLADATTVFLGSDVITQGTYDLMTQQEAEIAAIVQKYGALMSQADTYKRGWVQKSRKQHFQGGGADLTNYFTHSDRQRCEQSALAWSRT
jgi:hypothetical protein